MRLELTYFQIISYCFWDAVPFSRGPKAVTVLCKGEVSVGDDDLVCPIIPVHDSVKILWFLTLPDPESTE